MKPKYKFLIFAVIILIASGNRILAQTTFDFETGVVNTGYNNVRIPSDQGTLFSSVKTNVGFVPIINFNLAWHLNEKLGILVEGDALAAPQGRAEDVLVAATYRLSDLIGFKAGYRLLEGGAANDEVYSFALFHYASFGLYISL